MKKFNKKSVKKEDVVRLHEKYKFDYLEASILARRGITSGQDVMYYMESDTRFLHQPFLFSAMEDAVERINQAIEEKEKILIFGDKDVDGITSTAILYGYLKNRGADVQFRLPVGEDAYGLSMEAVDDFEAYCNGFSALIITVDCGISNNAEIDHANNLGIDVIVTDHHNPPEILPAAAVIVDPKTKDSGYPFTDISGAAVAFKLVSALRFSRTELYGQDFCLMHVKPEKDSYTVDCLKLRNLVKKARHTFSAIPGSTSVYNTKLPDFLSGQQIFVWNEKETKTHLRELFGTGVEFQMLDMQPEIAKQLPFVLGKSLEELRTISKIARYSDSPLTELDSFYNLFVTFAEKSAEKIFPKHKIDSENDLQLVAVAALADIMPLKNENRIFVKTGLAAMNAGKIRKGLAELIARSDLAGKKITSTDLSWKIIPSLNAAGRMGQSTVSLELLISESPQERNQKAAQIQEMNEQRKMFVADGESYTARQAEESLARFQNKLCIVQDARINRGITGILASKLMQKYNVPAIAITFSEDKTVAVGSMRSCRNLIATDFLDSFGTDFFLNHGGHNAAAGFSFNAGKLDAFIQKIQSMLPEITLDEENDSLDIDAELPADYITPELLTLIDKFEPFGEENPELRFISKNLAVSDAVILGKTERQHLKIMFDCGKYKFPALFWGEAARLNNDFSVKDRLDVIFNVTRNYYNGTITPQMILLDAQKSSVSE